VHVIYWVSNPHFVHRAQPRDSRRGVKQYNRANKTCEGIMPCFLDVNPCRNEGGRLQQPVADAAWLELRRSRDSPMFHSDLPNTSLRENAEGPIVRDMEESTKETTSTPSCWDILFLIGYPADGASGVTEDPKSTCRYPYLRKSLTALEFC